MGQGKGNEVLMIDIYAIEAARKRIGEHIYRTPCAYSEVLSCLCDCELYLKLENLQMTGSFKDRGALNKLLSLTEEQAAAGVIAASAGNHAQGVAHAARLLGIHAIIVMPETTPLAKIRGTEELGAEIVLHGSGYDEAFGRACELQRQHGFTLVHAFDDPLVIAGQGTVGLEILEQLPEVEAVVVPVGGGGLIGGIAAAVKARMPEVEVIGVEAERMAAMKQSVAAGKVTPLPMANTIADGISVARVGELTLPLVREYVSRIVTVSEEEIAAAIMTLLEREKTLAEGAGAAGFAALLHRHLQQLAGKKVVVVVSGGNIDMTRLSHILERGLELDGRLARLSVIVPDRPSGIAELTAMVASQHANIEQIAQNRSATEVALEETEVELLLQTRGREHFTQIIRAIKERGYRVKQ
jgi:threonine dehydratase